MTFADKDLLIGDEAAMVLLEYAAALSRSGQADTVTLQAYSGDGDEVEASFLLTQGTPIMAETSHNKLPEPDNAGAIEYMQRGLMRLSSPSPVMPEHDAMPDNYEDLELS
ncbi:MAG: hypothetical protein JWR33_114 [Naasia sp.]|nr:hypothetical protein [Naasia sp.]